MRTTEPYDKSFLEQIQCEEIENCFTTEVIEENIEKELVYKK